MTNSFILRNQEVFIYNSVNYFRVDKDTFTQLEPTFTLPINIKQVEYYPGILHQRIHFNGTIENLSTTSTTYDGYINKLDIYITLKEELDEQNQFINTPQTLAEAKQSVIKDIHEYCSRLTNSLVSEYSHTERDRWSVVILPEAKAYKLSLDPADCPNLTQQEKFRIGLDDIYSDPFKNSLLNRVNFIIDKNDYYQFCLNFYCGVRGKWVDTVNTYHQTPMETEQEAIQRLLDLDWKVGWELPPYPPVE